MQRLTLYSILFFCSWSGTALASIPKDSVIYKDTLIETKIIHSAKLLRIGIGGSYGGNYFTDKALPFPLSVSCDTFLTGKGSGLNFLGRIDIPIAEKLYITPVIAYENFTADHTWGEFAPTRTHTVEFDHVITASTKAIGMKALFGWQFFKPFTLEIGPALYYLFDNNYTKTEKAITPGDLIITPTDSVRELTEASGALPDARNLMAALSFSLGAEFPLSKKLWAVPNIELLLPITQSTSYWTQWNLRGGITFKYDLGGTSDTITEYRHEQIPVHIVIPEKKIPTLTASIEAIDPTGNAQHVVRLEVEEVRVHYAYPMLSYIFFDDGSSQIPERYARYASFAEAQKNVGLTILTGPAGLLGLYHQSLNILGNRLRTSSAKITITGCTSNIGIEAGNIPLAKARAETIKDYLVKIWQIDPKRIKTEARLLPEKPSPSDIPEGREENRRVEITSSDEALTDPLIITKAEHIANPPTIFLQPHVYAEAGLSNYRSSISLGGKELVAFNGAEQKAWSVPEEALSSGIDSLDLNLTVTDSAGNSANAHNAVKLEQRHIEREKQQELEKFSLILFAFDESKLGAKNERTLSLVAESFKKKEPQKLSIVGYTDELGDAAHNDELSRRRAAEASAELDRALQTRGLKLPDNTLIDGKGSRERLYDNSLPEGRFFSRTVNITVEHGQ